jgi:hypothetical protein
MAQAPYVIEQGPRGPGARLSLWLRGRRFRLAGVLALAQVLAVVIFDPSLVLASLAAFLVLVVAITLAVRVRKGVLRDLLVIVAIAEAMVVVLPLVLGVSVVVGLLLAVVLLVALIALAIRFRV